jgi:hypothetical protein
MITNGAGLAEAYLEPEGAIDVVLLGFGDFNHSGYEGLYLRAMHLGY